MGKGNFEKLHFRYFSGHLGILAAILDLRQISGWPKSLFLLVWSKEEESTEKIFPDAEWIKNVIVISVIEH